MKSSLSPFRTGAIIGAALISQPLAATAQPAAPPAVSQAETATKAPEHAAASQAARQNLVRDLDASSAANAAAKAFLERTNLSTADPSQPVPEPPQAKPLDLKPGPDDTLISCDGGMYFDPDEGVFVYMKNVRVTDPGFTMTGANELKIFLEKIPAEEIEKRKQERAAKKKAAGGDEKTDPPKKKRKRRRSRIPGQVRRSRKNHCHGSHRHRRETQTRRATDQGQRRDFLLQYPQRCGARQRRISLVCSRRHRPARHGAGADPRDPSENRQIQYLGPLGHLREF